MAVTVPVGVAESPLLLAPLQSINEMRQSTAKMERAALVFLFTEEFFPQRVMSCAAFMTPVTAMKVSNVVLLWTQDT
jgi:hypothetical protein